MFLLFHSFYFAANFMLIACLISWMKENLACSDCMQYYIYIYTLCIACSTIYTYICTLHACMPLCDATVHSISLIHASVRTATGSMMQQCTISSKDDQRTYDLQKMRRKMSQAS
jgi:hypothetical protein